MRVDSHQHFWTTKRNDYGWLNERSGSVLYRDYMPGDLAPLLTAHGIDRTILVQAAPSVAETCFLLELAARAPFVGGVVGWADFEDADAPRVIADLAGRGALVGLRPMLQDLDDDEWILRRRIEPALAAMRDHDLCLDILGLPRHLPHVARFLARHPELRCVIDHAAKPAIARGELVPWAAEMRRIARESAALCKLSGLATEAGHGWSASTMKPYVEVLLEAFGPERLMWGSDWPVLNLAGSYAGWLETAEQLVAGLPQAARSLVFGGTAAEFYRIR